MDPVTHGLMSVCVTQAVFAKPLGPKAWWIGLLAGLLPDIDVVFRFTTDEVTALLLHRHFTHSLLLLPLGALMGAAPFFWVEGWQEHRWEVYAAALLAFAGHLLLDLFTSWGTMLLWPFSPRRIAWDCIAIIDLPFLGLLLAGLVLGSRQASAVPLWIFLGLASLYLVFGFWQRERGRAVQERLARERGHQAIYGRVLPMLGSPLSWRSVYRCGDRLYADALRLPLFTEAVCEGGESLSLAHLEDVLGQIPAVDRSRLEQFWAFADGFVGILETAPGVWGDMRYSRKAGTFQPLWGVRVEPGKGLRFARLGLPAVPGGPSGETR